MASTKKATPEQSSPLQKVFKSGVKQAVVVLTGEKSLAQAAKRVLKDAERAERQGSAGKRTKT